MRNRLSLRDPAQTTLVLVARAGRSSLTEAERTRAELARLGLAKRAVEQLERRAATEVEIHAGDESAHEIDCPRRPLAAAPVDGSRDDRQLTRVWRVTVFSLCLCPWLLVNST